jgi:hypothetical protein
LEKKPLRFFRPIRGLWKKPLLLLKKLKKAKPADELTYCYETDQLKNRIEAVISGKDNDSNLAKVLSNF